jgi:hypothetical protein
MIDRLEIDLRLPFEENIKRAVALSASARRRSEGEMIGALRRLYELAHGRSVQTTLGLIPFAPAVAPCLSGRKFSVAIHSDLLTATANQTAALEETSNTSREDLHPSPTAISKQS